MNTLSTTFVEETKDLLQSIKRNYLVIAVNVFKMREAQEWNEQEWVDFYEQELELSKSTVSKLLKVGEWIVAQSFCAETLPPVGYQNLYLSIGRNKDAKPEYILAEASTWRKEDYQDAKKDECDHNFPKILVCSHCFKRMDI